MDRLLDLGFFVAGGFCHQHPAHSLFFAGHQLPLCARCTGMHLGLYLGVAYGYLVRKRTEVIPSWGVAFAVALGLGSMLVEVILGSGILWHTTNLSRLGTGLAGGYALSLLLSPLLFNPSPDPRVSRLGLGWSLAGYTLPLGLGWTILLLPGALWPLLCFFFGVSGWIILVLLWFGLMRQASAAIWGSPKLGLWLPLGFGAASVQVLMMGALRSLIYR